MRLGERTEVLKNLERFSSYEQLLVSYHGLTNATQLRLTAGPKKFFEEFHNWLKAPSKPMAVLGIPPDPTTSLIFPNLRDELLAALRIVAVDAATEENARSLLLQYELQDEHLLRPITALSGGERLLGAFAKAHALAPHIQKLVLSNPTHWLAPSRHRLVEHLLERYVKQGQQVHVLALDGESFMGDTPTLAPVANWDSSKMDEDANWQLKVESPMIQFPEVTFPERLRSKTIRFETEQKTICLRSPALMVGDNGVGKSLFAKCLAEVWRLSSGYLEVSYHGTCGPARLVMQDAIGQLFGQSIDHHLNYVFRYDSEMRKKAITLTEVIENAVRDVVKRNPARDQSIIGASPERDSLLQAKIVLAAERIASRPPLLILDEPGWCMAADLARAFVCAVCTEAAKARMGVLIISHQEGWWCDVARSTMRLTKSDSETVKIEADSHVHG